MRSLLNKIFRGRLSRGKLVSSILAFVVGLTMVLLSSDVYLKIKHVLSSGEGNSHYLVVNKEVGRLNVLGGFFSSMSATINEATLEETREKPFVRKATPMVSCLFASQVRIDMPQFKGKYLEIPFEAVPDDYLDVRPSGWGWKEGEEMLPVLISRDFYNMYNFGLTVAKGYPQFTESDFKKVPLNIRVRGNGKQKVYQARVVGFTDRYSSVLAPMEFMAFANRTYGDKELSGYSRIVMEVENPSDPAVQKFLSRKGLQTNKDKLRSGKAGLVVKLVLGVILVLGLFFILLSFQNIATALALMVAEAREEVRMLVELGFTQGLLSNYFLKFVAGILAIETLLVVALFMFCNHFINAQLASFGFAIDSAYNWLTIGIGALLLVANFLLFQFSLKRVIGKYG